jgi:hypothetical protein
METIMRMMMQALMAILMACLAGCAAFKPVTLNAGEPEAQVLAKLGQPTHQYRDKEDRLLEYMTGPWGQKTFMARIGPDGKLKTYEQVLTTEKFATIREGAASKDEVLRTIGAPSETSYLSLPELEVWSYPYKESGVWNSMMHVHFDRSGIVRKMMNGPDPKFDPDRRFPFGLR